MSKSPSVNYTKLTTAPNEERSYDFAQLYSTAYAELTSQQSKRDQIITLYLAIITFLVPFSFSLEALTNTLRSVLYLAMGLVGIILALIIIRYKLYKDAYWLSLQTLPQLSNYDPNLIDADLTQALFFSALEKKGKGYITEKNKLSFGIYFKKNIFSAETLYFVIHALITGAIIALGLAMMLPQEWGVIVAVSTGVVALCVMIVLYMTKTMEMYRPLQYKRQLQLNDSDELRKKLNDSFTNVFKKAWVLHIYPFKTDDNTRISD